MDDEGLREIRADPRRLEPSKPVLTLLHVFVPLLALPLVIFSGCYLNHGEHCGPPAGQVCCDEEGRSVTASRECFFDGCPPGSTLVPRRACVPEVEPWPITLGRGVSP